MSDAGRPVGGVSDEDAVAAVIAVLAAVQRRDADPYETWRTARIAVLRAAR